jgi:hypothetical protein
MSEAYSLEIPPRVMRSQSKNLLLRKWTACPCELEIAVHVISVGTQHLCLATDTVNEHTTMRFWVLALALCTALLLRGVVMGLA